MESPYAARTRQLRQRLEAVAQRAPKEQTQEGDIEEGRSNVGSSLIPAPGNTEPNNIGRAQPINRPTTHQNGHTPSRVFTATIPITNISAIPGSANSSYGISTCSTCEQPYTRAWLETELDTENKAVRVTTLRLPCDCVEDKDTMGNWLNKPASPEWTRTPADAYPQVTLFNGPATPTIAGPHYPSVLNYISASVAAAEQQSAELQRRGAIRRGSYHRIRSGALSPGVFGAENQYQGHYLSNSLINPYPESSFISRAANQQPNTSTYRADNQYQGRFLGNSLLNPHHRSSSGRGRGNGQESALARVSPLNLGQANQAVRGPADLQRRAIGSSLLNPYLGTSFVARVENYPGRPVYGRRNFNPSQEIESVH